MLEGEKTLVLRPLARGGTPDAGYRVAARLHLRGLPREFTSRFGEGFMARYYRAFAESPHAVALAAEDRATGRIVGVVAGALEPRQHFSWLVRRHGPSLAVEALSRTARRPRLARDLLRTRAGRYLRGLVRSLRAGGQPAASPEQVGLLVYVVVGEAERGRGIGASLLRAFEERAREAGLDRLELVTPPGEDGAGAFYTKVGWESTGAVASRSGEVYDLYTLRLRA